MAAPSASSSPFSTRCLPGGMGVARDCFHLAAVRGSTYQAAVLALCVPPKGVGKGWRRLGLEGGKQLPTAKQKGKVASSMATSSPCAKSPSMALHACSTSSDLFRSSLLGRFDSPPAQRSSRQKTAAQVASSNLPQIPLLPETQLWAAVTAIVSKILGYLVICGSLFLKVPQILRVVRSRSVEGLNKFSFETECLGYTMALAYCVSKGVPFHVYGELFFILAQSIVLMGLIYRFSPSCRWTKIKVSLYIAAAVVLFFGNLPPQFLETSYHFQTTMFTLARVPQVWTNFRDSSTGELSATSSILSVAGCVARIFTSIYSRAPVSMIISSIAGLCSHGILLLQILYYGSRLRPKMA